MTLIAHGHNKFANVYKLSKERATEAHWLYRKAIETGQRAEHKYTENGYEYTTYAYYDEALGAIVTNYGGCPLSYNHHIGQLCTVCGNDERHIHPIRRRK